MAQTIKEIQKLTKEISVLAKRIDETTKKTQEYKDELAEVNKNKSIEKMAKAFEDTTKAIDKTEKNLKGLEEAFSSTAKEADSISDATKHSFKPLENLRTKLEAARKEAETLRSTGAGDPKKYDEVQKKIEEIEKEYGKLTSVIGKTTVDATKNLIQSTSEAGGSAKGLWKALTSGSPRQMTAAAESAGTLAKSMKLGGEAIAPLPGLLGAAGKAAMGLGGALGKVAALAGGLPGLIVVGVIGALKTIHDGILKMDNYIKGLNKKFASVRGPDIMTGDVQKQMKEFNDAVYDIGKNIRDGMKADEVQAFMESITQAGVAIGQLNKGMYGYRDATYIAAKASKTLGLEIPEVGNMMGKLMTDFTMDLDEVDTAFVGVAFDAQKSGLSTTRFWSAVENASASLAFYGKFADAASKAIAGLTESQLVGADTAAKVGTEMFQTFAKNSTQANMMIIGMAKQAGGFSKRFKEAAKVSKEGFKTQADQIGEQIVKVQAETETPETIMELEKLRKEQAAAQTKADRLQQIADGHVVAEGQDLAMMADQSPDILAASLRGAAGIGTLATATDQSTEAMMNYAKSAGLSPETVRTLIENTKATKKEMQNMVGVGEQGEKNDGSLIASINDLDNKSQLEGVAKLLEGDITDENTEDTADKMSKILKLTKGDSKRFIMMAKTDGAMKKYMVDLVRSGTKGQIDNKKQEKLFNKMVDGSDVSDKIAAKDMMKREKTNKELKKNASSTFDKMVKNTLSLEDIEKIISEGMYEKVMIGLLSGMSEGITGIARKYLASVTTEAKEKAAGKVDQSFVKKGGLLGMGGPEDLSALGWDELARGVKTLSQTQDKLQKKLSKQETFSAIKEAKKPADIIEGKLLDIGKPGAGAEESQSFDAVVDLLKQSNALGKLGEGDIGGQLSAIKKTLMDPNSSDDEKKKAKESLKVMMKNLRLATKDGKITKAIQEKADEQAKALDQGISDDKVQIAKLTDQNKNLETIAGLSKEQEELFAASLSQSEDGRKAIVKLTKEKFGEGPKIDVGAMRKTTFGEQAYEMLKKAGKITGKEKEIDTSLLESIPTKAGLQGAETVKTPGLINLHSPEVIAPSDDYLANKPPSGRYMPSLGAAYGGKAPMIGAAAGGGGAGAGGGQNITITVTATEKDLAQRIANEVRGVLYQQKVNG